MNAEPNGVTTFTCRWCGKTYSSQWPPLEEILFPVCLACRADAAKRGDSEKPESEKDPG